MGRVKRGVGLAGAMLAWLVFAPGVASAEISLSACLKQNCESVVLPTDDIPNVGPGLSVPLASSYVCGTLGRDLSDTKIPVGDESVEICPADRFGFTIVRAEVDGTQVRDSSYHGGLGPSCPCAGQSVEVGDDLALGISSYHRAWWE